jgi:hypothetical protein
VYRHSGDTEEVVILAKPHEVVILAKPHEVVILAKPESPYLSCSATLYSISKLLNSTIISFSLRPFPFWVLESF